MTDEQKLERYEKMNIGFKPKYHKGKHVKDWWTCGQCGTTVFDGVTSNFCMNCGYRIKWKNDRSAEGRVRSMSKITVKLTEQMEKDKKNCCEDLCTSEDCTLWMKNADCCLLELEKEVEE